MTYRKIQRKKGKNIGGEDMLTEKELRTLELANRLQDMTAGEWCRVRKLIDSRFESKKREMERELQLSSVREDDLIY